MGEATEQQRDRSGSASPLATAGELAAMLGGDLRGDGAVAITGFNALDQAERGDLSFIRSSEFAPKWASSAASVAIVTKGVAVEPGEGRALVFVESADAAVAMVLRAAAERANPPRPPAGVHPSAVVDPGARVDASAVVGAFVSVEAGAEIGAGVWLHPGVRIGHNARIGGGTQVHANAVIGPGVRIGSRCNIYAGVSIGAEGFAYFRDPAGRNVPLPHLASVTVGDDVDIGANTAIDRGKFFDTKIGDGVKIDNLVQMGHGCQIGDHAVVCGACAVGGSVTLGAGVTLGGGVKVRDGVTIGDHAVVGAASQVGSDLKGGEEYLGSPAGPARNAVQAMIIGQRLPDLRRQVQELSKLVRTLQRDG